MCVRSVLIYLILRGVVYRRVHLVVYQIVPFHLPLGIPAGIPRDHVLIAWRPCPRVGCYRTNLHDFSGLLGTRGDSCDGLVPVAPSVARPSLSCGPSYRRVERPVGTSPTQDAALRTMPGLTMSSPSVDPVILYRVALVGRPWFLMMFRT
jgi:hypothetical protein